MIVLGLIQDCMDVQLNPFWGLLLPINDKVKMDKKGILKSYSCQLLLGYLHLN